MINSGNGCRGIKNGVELAKKIKAPVTFAYRDKQRLAGENIYALGMKEYPAPGCGVHLAAKESGTAAPPIKYAFVPQGLYP